MSHGTRLVQNSMTKAEIQSLPCLYWPCTFQAWRWLLEFFNVYGCVSLIFYSHASPAPTLTVILRLPGYLFQLCQLFFLFEFPGRQNRVENQHYVLVTLVTLHTGELTNTNLARRPCSSPFGIDTGNTGCRQNPLELFSMGKEGMQTFSIIVMHAIFVWLV